MKKTSSIFLELHSSQRKSLGKKDLIAKAGRSSQNLDVMDYCTRFQQINAASLSWLNVHMEIEDNSRLSFTSEDKFTGIIPLRSPFSGLQVGDFILLPKKTILPKSDGLKDTDLTLSSLHEIYEIANQIGELPEIDFFDGPDLKSGHAFPPPSYFQALKYIQTYEEATHENWRKFVSANRVYDYPRSSTNWNRYALQSYDPNNSLRYESRVNMLTRDHAEWMKLTTVYHMALSTISAPNTPFSVKAKADPIRSRIDRMTHDGTLPYDTGNNLITGHFTISTLDPQPIKVAKTEANRYLSEKYASSKGWRIDVSVLFERYVQYLFERACISTSWSAKRNARYHRNGYKPSWSLAYLEPDIQLINNQKETTIPVDMKYKNHLIFGNNGGDQLKETFRTDLHQILAYSSFSPLICSDDSNKLRVCALAYPDTSFSTRYMTFHNPFSGIAVKVYLIGVPFRAETLTGDVSELQKWLESLIRLDSYHDEKDRDDPSSPIT